MWIFFQLLVGVKVSLMLCKIMLNQDIEGFSFLAWQYFLKKNRWAYLVYILLTLQTISWLEGEPRGVFNRASAHERSPKFVLQV